MIYAFSNACERLIESCPRGSLRRFLAVFGVAFTMCMSLIGLFVVGIYLSIAVLALTWPALPPFWLGLRAGFLVAFSFALYWSLSDEPDGGMDSWR